MRVCSDSTTGRAQVRRCRSVGQYKRAKREETQDEPQGKYVNQRLLNKTIQMPGENQRVGEVDAYVRFVVEAIKENIHI